MKTLACSQCWSFQDFDAVSHVTMFKSLVMRMLPALTLIGCGPRPAKLVTNAVNECTYVSCDEISTMIIRPGRKARSYRVVQRPTRRSSLTSCIRIPLGWPWPVWTGRSSQDTGTARGLALESSSRIMDLTLKHTRVTLKLRGLLSLKCARPQVKCTHGSFFFSSLQPLLR